VAAVVFFVVAPSGSAEDFELKGILTKIDYVEGVGGPSRTNTVEFTVVLVGKEYLIQIGDRASDFPIVCQGNEDETLILQGGKERRFKNGTEVTNLVDLATVVKGAFPCDTEPAVHAIWLQYLSVELLGSELSIKESVSCGVATGKRRHPYPDRTIIQSHEGGRFLSNAKFYGNPDQVVEGPLGLLIETLAEPFANGYLSGKYVLEESTHFGGLLIPAVGSLYVSNPGVGKANDEDVVLVSKISCKTMSYSPSGRVIQKLSARSAVTTVDDWRIYGDIPIQYSVTNSEWLDVSQIPVPSDFMKYRAAYARKYEKSRGFFLPPDQKLHSYFSVARVSVAVILILSSVFVLRLFLKTKKREEITNNK